MHMHGIQDAESSEQRDLHLADLRSREDTARATETPEVAILFKGSYFKVIIAL